MLRPFTLTSVELAQCAYPRALKRFNRIDLPLFWSKATWRNRSPSRWTRGTPRRFRWTDGA